MGRWKVNGNLLPPFNRKLEISAHEKQKGKRGERHNRETDIHSIKKKMVFFFPIKKYFFKKGSRNPFSVVTPLPPGHLFWPLFCSVLCI